MLAFLIFTRRSFDQARLIRHNQILARNGVDPSGSWLTHILTVIWNANFCS
jgi:Fungal protein of unknown function (DUF2015)